MSRLAHKPIGAPPIDGVPLGLALRPVYRPTRGQRQPERQRACLFQPPLLPLILPLHLPRLEHRRQPSRRLIRRMIGRGHTIE